MYDAYINTIKNELNKNSELWNFKRDANYRAILEHVNLSQALSYIELCFKEFDADKKSEWVDIFKKNDMYGNPIQENLGNNIGNFSPSNARYLYHSLLTLKHLQSLEIKNIVEIGGGYGGLCLYINSLSNNTYNYSIFDLPEVMLLQAKYLTAHNIQCNFLDFHSQLPDKFYLISNYCYSEIPDLSIRKKYQNVIDRSDAGFMLWNADAMKSGASISETFANKNIITNIENPLTAPGNLEIYWSN